jgi:hypothetical protein
MSVRVQVTLSDHTVDKLWEELGKFREVGWGAAEIDWHTSRGHLGKQITMSLSLDNETP